MIGALIMLVAPVGGPDPEVAPATTASPAAAPVTAMRGGTPAPALPPGAADQTAFYRADGTLIGRRPAASTEPPPAGAAWSATGRSRLVAISEVR